MTDLILKNAKIIAESLDTESAMFEITIQCPRKYVMGNISDVSNLKVEITEQN